MRNKLREIVLTASVLLALSFTLSCAPADDDDGNSNSGKKKSSSSKNNGSSSSKNNSSSSGGKVSSSSSFDVNSQIYKYECGYDYNDEEEYELCQYVAYADSGNVYDYYLGELGTVTNGKVHLDLNSSSDVSEYLEDFLSLDEDEDEDDENEDGEEKEKKPCSEYTKGLEVYKASFQLNDSDNYYVGSLSILNEGEDESENNEILYWYFSKAGKIVCNFNEEVKYELNVKEGWNQIYKKTTFDDEYHYYGVEEYSTKNILTKEVKWFLSWGG
ncbi:MAG: hypothetical protein LBC75_11115 [Fibromonadaceae bacterium]|jgi:hypothetical protein|nr:hypothetical protein [Fibromonadaceae bacterium]